MLLEHAHARGLKLLVDLVPCHTSDRHPWFQEARVSRDNHRADWYVFAEPRADGTPPNNWLSVFGGVAWTWEPRRRQYYLHSFLPSQPALNWHNPAVADAVRRRGRVLARARRRRLSHRCDRLRPARRGAARQPGAAAGSAAGRAASRRPRPTPARCTSGRRAIRRCRRRCCSPCARWPTATTGRCCSASSAATTRSTGSPSTPVAACSASPTRSICCTASRAQPAVRAVVEALEAEDRLRLGLLVAQQPRRRRAAMSRFGSAAEAAGLQPLLTAHARAACAARSACIRARSWA